MSHSKTKKILSGFLGLTVALSMVLSAATANAAITADDIDKLVLLGIIPADKAAAAKAAFGVSGTPAAGSYVFTENLKVGSRGEAVWNLQKVLNTNPATQVAPTGPGSPGSETQYFGPATLAAVKKYQTSKGVPSTGFVGPLTRAELNKGVVVVTPPPPPGTPPPPVVPGSGISVAAGTQPANSLAPQNAARVPFTRFTLTAGSDGDVIVNSVTVERTGLANDAVFAGIILLDETGKQLGIARTFGSDHRAIVGESVTIPRGTTKTFTLAGNMAASLGGRAGEVPVLSVVAVNTAATVSGTLPISGAAHTINATLTIGTVTNERGASDPNGAQTKNVGDTGITFSAIKVTAGSQEKIKISSIRWNQASSAGASDLANIKSYVDGVAYDTTLSADGKFYTSTFGDGLILDKGFSKEILVKGDLVGGSGRTAAFNLEKTTDIYLVGETYGYGITPPTSGTGFTGGTIWYAASTFTINQGTLTVENATSVTAQNIALNQANQVLGGFAADVKGEPITVASMTFNVATTGTRTAGSDALLLNVTIVDANGKVVAGPVDATYFDNATQRLTYSDTVLFPVGKNTYTLKGKVGPGFGNNGTIIVSTQPGGSSAPRFTDVTGQVTSKTVTPSPTSSVSLNTMTVKNAAITISALPNPSSQTVVAGANNLLVAKIHLDASASGEDVKMNAIPLDTSVNSSTANITRCTLYSGATAIQTGSNELTSFSNSSTTNFQFDSALIIAKGATKTLDLKCTFNSSASGTYRFGYSDTASPSVTGVTSGQNATLTEITSASGLLTFATSGTLSVALDAGSPSYTLANANSTQVVSALRITGRNEDIRINEIGLQFPPNTTTTPTDVVKVTLWDGVTQVGETVFSPGLLFASSTFGNCTGCSQFTVPRNEDKVLTIKATLAAQGDGQIGIPGALVAVDYDGDGNGSNVSGGIAGTGLLSGVKITAAGSDSASAGVRVVRSVPTFEVVSLSDTKLVAGRRDLFRFKITASSNGQVGINKFTFRLATSSGTSQSGMVIATNVYAFTSSTYGSGSEASGIQTDGAFLGTSKVGGNWVDNNTDLSFHPHDSSNASTSVSIPAGQTYYFVLRGDVTLAGTTYNVSTQLQGDNRYYTPMTRVYNVSQSGASTTLLATSTYFDNSADLTLDDFIWRPHSTTSSRSNTANDYLNGYGIPGLNGVNTNSQILSN